MMQFRKEGKQINLDNPDSRGLNVQTRVKVDLLWSGRIAKPSRVLRDREEEEKLWRRD